MERASPQAVVLSHARRAPPEPTGRGSVEIWSSNPIIELPAERQAQSRGHRESDCNSSAFPAPCQTIFTSLPEKMADGYGPKPSGLAGHTLKAGPHSNLALSNEKT
jgi:hypothetical protein